MPHRIEVMFKPHLRDSRGERIARKAVHDLGLPVIGVRTVKVYLLDIALPQDRLQDVAHGPLSDPVIHVISVDSPVSRAHDFPWTWVVEVGYRPGVTDNEGRIATEAIELLLGRRVLSTEGVYTAVQYLVEGDLAETEIRKLADGLLANELIERTIVLRRDLFDETWERKGGGLFFAVPRVLGEKEPRVEEFDLSALSDGDLICLSRNRLLALSLPEMAAIRAYFERPEVLAERQRRGLSRRITDVELEALAQTWSEHCKHKIFNSLIRYTEGNEERIIDSLFETCIKAATKDVRSSLGDRDWCLSVFNDNAGVIRFNDRWGIAFKVETHNSPSALDPYGGALTGIVGVNRDPFGTGMGARLIFNTDVFCFAPPDYPGPIPRGLLHPKRIFEGVREGVEHGGNKSGIPTVNGSIVFDERYLGKPLVFCGTGGVLPLEVCGRPGHEKRAHVGDAIVMCGGRIGKDGIHGATFSSEELHEGSPATAVQIGDPITQKKMTDFLLRARDLCLYTSITDNGAGGLSSSVGEMAKDTGGFELHLDKAPLKYQGLDPWEILLSEAQERMTVAVPPEKLEEFLALAEKMDVEATVLGTFTDSGLFHCLYKGRTVACLDLGFAHEGVPRMELEAVWSPPVHSEPVFPCPEDLTGEIMAILSRYNVCSKEYVVRQYDHEVQGGSVVKPMVGILGDGPSDAAVIRPDLASFEGLVIAHGICPKYSAIDTYHMVACAVDEAVRNAVCVGGGLDLMAGLDNFCWCDPIQSEKTPDGRYKLAQLVRANLALSEICRAYGVPCISGKDSMKNDAIIEGVKISIPPTLLFSVISRMDDVRRAVTMDAKRPGDGIYVLGVTYPEFGGSEYYARCGFVGNTVPRVRIPEAKARYLALSKAIRHGLVASCHDCSDGGLAVALAETAFSGGLGMEIDLGLVPAKGVDRLDHLLFSESQSRFVVTVAPEKERAFQEAMSGTAFARIGHVTEGRRFALSFHGDHPFVSVDIQDLKDAWKRPLDW